MEITVTVNLNESQQRAFAKQLAFAQQSQPQLTASGLAQHLLVKLFAKWADDEREAFIQKNRAFIETIVAALAVDPNRAAKLAPLGVEFSEDGTLRPIGSP